MLAISELVRVALTVDDEGSSPLALSVAEPWSGEHVLFVRSSTNHVFLLSGGAGETVLRFRPADAGALERSREVADLAARLAAAGAPVAAALPSCDGRLAVELQVGESVYVASVYARASGRQIESESATPAEARAWGRGLALFHDAARQLEPPPRRPRWIDVVRDAAETVRERGVRDAGGAIVETLEHFVSDGNGFGVAHGDPELDNVIWQGAAPVFVDLDDAAWSWLAADISFALRDFSRIAGAPDAASPHVAAFLAGYGEVRAFDEDELSSLSMFGRAHALVLLARLERTLDEAADPDWPEWATALRGRIERIAAGFASAIVAAGEVS